MIYSKIFNATISRLGEIVFANRSDSEVFAGDFSHRYEDHHTETRNINLFLFKVAFEYLRKGNTEFANETINIIFEKLADSYGVYKPSFEIKHYYTNDVAIENTLEGLIQKVDYLQNLESYNHFIPADLWLNIASLYLEIERCLHAIYEKGYYNATLNIKFTEKAFNDFTSNERVRELNLAMTPYAKTVV